MSDVTKQEKKPVTLKGIKFLVGSFVYLKTDPYQQKRIVTAIHLTPGAYQYEVRFADNDSSLHYDVELSEEKDESSYGQPFLSDLDD